MALHEVTQTAVLAAIREYDELGREAFLSKYGFARARAYYLVHEHRSYDSKAIVGAAHGYLPGKRPLARSDFSGGQKTVRAKLLELGFKVSTGERNPPWTRDELILALDLYFQHRPDRISKAHPGVIALSRLLNELPLQPDRPDAARFRNPNGVYMKLCNFLRFDPDYAGAGLNAGGRGEEVIWDEFSKDRERLRLVAAAIRRAHESAEVRVAAVDEVDDEEFPEGRILLRLHRARERSARLRDRAKRRALEQLGRLACVACGFDFSATYGAVGDGYIECHHLTAISDLEPGATSRVEDLVLLCANCHRMVHRRRPWLTLANLRDLLPPKDRILPSPSNPTMRPQ